MSATSLRPSLRWCPSCHGDIEHFAPGPSGRPDATCPACGAHERHRFLAVLLDGLAPWLTGASLVLDVAPSRQMARRMARLCPRGYASLDFDPAADGRRVDIRASLTALPLPDDCVDLLLCYHVLEHVPEDRTAMKEIARVLKPGGLALIQVPWRGDQATDEDPSASVEERVRRFGQSDHVRHYGKDFDDRLVAAGLDVTRLTPQGVLGRLGCQLMRLVEDEAVWVVRPRRQGDESWHAVEGAEGSSTAFLTRLVAEARARERRHDASLVKARDEAMSQVSALEEVERRARELGRQLRARDRELRAAREEARRWRRAYEKMRGRLPVRVAAGLLRRLRLLRSRLTRSA
ncbi:class I SAM-dependent methyltransferase [Pseudokineococcus sp. 1T1Z-3]|uniref:class I SAM-dependent methyltransferase n=1 Tax=Pseudokineococcus sp. 1T1Z-3 TaxID=3132745 RepID=UPI00309FEA48